MACFLPMIFLLSPVTDNLKREKILNGCIIFQHCQHIRSAYIKSYFAFYGILIFIGLIIGLIAVLAIHQNLMLTLISGLVGIGAAGTYAIMFPLTFKFGPENSKCHHDFNIGYRSYFILYYLLWYYYVCHCTFRFIL